LIYARVFTNIANSEAYYQMFNSLFDWVFKLTEKLPQFYYIHKMGWKCIIEDLDNSQAKGLEIWLKAPDNTNVEEASYANINHDGKALSLENVIL
ncbi:23676_t:CDS:2, partial [Cetraspora pellucida]